MNEKDTKTQELMIELAQLRKIVLMLNNRLTHLERQNRTLKAGLDMQRNKVSTLERRIRG